MATTIFQKITEEKLVKCSSCLEDALERLIGGQMATLRFEGNGYYITDYGPNKKTAKKAESSPSSSCACDKKKKS